MISIQDTELNQLVIIDSSPFSIEKFVRNVYRLECAFVVIEFLNISLSRCTKQLYVHAHLQQKIVFEIINFLFFYLRSDPELQLYCLFVFFICIFGSFFLSCSLSLFVPFLKIGNHIYFNQAFCPVLSPVMLIDLGS